MDPHCSEATDTLREKIRDIEELGDRTFRKLEWDLVTRYRRCEDDQEWIARALAEKTMGTGNPKTEERVTEILAMLDHVHDPLISAVS